MSRGNTEVDVRTGLTAVLSEPAARLYERLILTEGISLVDNPELSGSEAVKELVARGFARERYIDVPQLVAVEPARAVDNAILAEQRQVLDRYQKLLRLRDEIDTLQRSYVEAGGSGTGPSDTVRVLTDRQEISALSVELCLSARHQVHSLETEHFTRPPDPRAVRSLPPELVARGVQFRNVYAKAVLDLPGARQMLHAAVESGWQCRVYPRLPMKMVLVDEQAALLPLGPTGMEGALLVRAPVIVAALREFFELVWRSAIPIDGAGSLPAAELPAEASQVLKLVLAGMTDAAIARYLGISERGVRRQVGTLLKHFGATNRITLAVSAVRKGWSE
jgi:DNA-binding CsgD family transcriptional regulator